MKLWHLGALALLAIACAPPRRRPGPPVGAEPVPPDSPDEGPPEDVFVFVHDRALLSPTLAAARRLEAASGIPIHVNAYGTVESAAPIHGSDYLCAAGTEGRANAAGITIARECNRRPPETVILHELFHLLGVERHLALPERGILNAASDAPLDRISADDLNALCEARACAAFNPEI